MPPLFGLLVSYVTITLYPVYLGLFLLLMIIMTERFNRLVKSNNRGC